MIYLTSNIGGEARFAAYAQAKADGISLGLLLAQEASRTPWCEFWAGDNGAWANRDNPSWWSERGELRWLKWLDVVVKYHAPLFMVLPDVVGDWDTTLERAYRYRHEVETRGMRAAIALQDGCQWKEVADFAPFAVFVGGTDLWKWSNVPRICSMFKNKSWIHVGRVNGEKRIRYVRKLGADSADGTGLARHFNDQLPRVLRGLSRESSQVEFFE